MKLLLTGATGFIGSHVARALVRDRHEVHALIRPQSDFSRIEDIKASLHLVEGDLLDSSFIPHPSSFDLCLHFAWYVESGKYLHAPQNKDWVAASLQLARGLKNSGCRRFIAAGTCFEYASSDPPQHESNPTAPTTIYVESKLAFFHALESLGLEIVWLRFFYQYGPYEDPRRLVPAIINSLLRGQEVKLVPGDRLRDYLYVEDAARAVVAAATSNLTGPINIGRAVPTTVREIGCKIGEIIGRPDLIKLGALPYSPNEPMNIVADNTKLRNTGWKSRVSLDEGLRQTVEWWKSQQRPTLPVTSGS